MANSYFCFIKNHYKFFIFLSLFCGAFRFPAIAQKTYFQQKADYKIDVSLNDQTNMLAGNLELNYANNSPDTLNFIYMHLWPNAYKDRTSALSRELLEDGSPALFFAEKIDRGFIDSIEFSIGDRKLKIEYEQIDICKVYLHEPLLPGRSILIKTPFRVKIPNSKFSRLGHTGDAFYVSQWYPKPAVYDVNGWHPMPYRNLGEFYSEFGRFEVSITLPSNYVVAATGELQEESEINWLETKSNLKVDNVPLKNDSFPESSAKWKTITFIQDSIHDFAWFADKRFNISTGEVILPVSGRKVKTVVYYTKYKASTWVKTPEYIGKGIQFLAEEVGEYPYSSFSVIDGTVSAGGGMEYPMITIINSPDNLRSFESTVFHELCHNWFYGILASNERNFGWMDEGITSYYEMKYAEKYMNSNAQITSDFLGKLVGLEQSGSYEILEFTYRFSSFNNSDQPISTPSEEFTSLNYGTVLYSKTALTFSFLHDYLGDSLFRYSMRNYFQQWKFKHPQPDDLQKSIEQSSGKSLDWLFKELFSTNKPVKINIDDQNDSSITLTNNSGIPIPVKVENERGEFIWVSGFNNTATINFPFSESELIYLNKDYAALFKSNELPYRSGKNHRKCPEIKLKNFYKVSDEPGTENIYVLPVPAWNKYNNWMAGIHVSNMDLIPEPFEFYAVPLYDFSNNNVAGIAGFDYNLWPITGTFNEIKFSLRTKRFAFADNTTTDEEFRKEKPVFFYSKVAPGVRFTLRKSTARSPVTHTFGYRNISIWLDEIKYTPVDSVYVKSYEQPYFNFNDLTYQFRNDRTIDPFSTMFRAEQGSEHIKLSMEFNYRFSYKKNKKGIDIRLFAGGFVLNKTTDRNYNFRMAGWDGSQDYLYDETFFGRTEESGWYSRQFLVRDGGFKVPTFVGQTNQWLASMNVTVDLPVPLPIKLFADIGTYEGISTTFDDIDAKVMYDGGIAISAVKDVLEIFIPLFTSDDIKRSHEVNNIKFADQIRFVLNLNKLTPLYLRNQTIQSFQ